MRRRAFGWMGLVLLAVTSAQAQPARIEAWTWPGYDRLPLALDTTETPRPPDPWLGRDKALHAGGSFLLTLSAQYVLTDKAGASNGEALPFAIGSALTLGLAKEVMDSQRPLHPHFSTRDLVADAVGVLLAVGVVLL
ncbi:MAG: hypothetical protein HKN04_01005 [Rhodothermaceae bacterium]|nr:hypothetical protein [Rhodothermaceae bacterium]